MESIKLLALSGSLRQSSYNMAAIKALTILAPSHVKITIGNIGDLPLFNPDRENENISTIEELKLSLKEAGGLVIASPEYAHGISGSMKNALDWLVSGEEFPYKPIMLINTSPRASHGQESLKEVLNTMSGNIIESSCLSIPLLSSDLDFNGIVADREISQTLLVGLSNFCSEIEELKIHK